MRVGREGGGGQLGGGVVVMGSGGVIRGDWGLVKVSERLQTT